MQRIMRAMVHNAPRTFRTQTGGSLGESTGEHEAISCGEGGLNYAGGAVALCRGDRCIMQGENSQCPTQNQIFGTGRDALCSQTGCIMQRNGMHNAAPPCIMQLAKGVQLPPVRVWQANLTHYAKSGCSSTVNLIEPPYAFLRQFVDFLQN